MGISSQAQEGLRGLGTRLRIAGIAGLGGASIVSIWSGRDVLDGLKYLADQYGWGWAMTALLSALLIVSVIVWWHGTKNQATVYQNQEVLNKARGGLPSELANCNQAWVIWQAGGSARNLPRESLKGHIQRMILLHPDVDLGGYIKSFDAGNTDNVRGSIRLLTHNARLAGVEVRHHHAPNFSVIINDPVSDSAWARIEVLLPMSTASKRPSLFISKNTHPELFRSLVQSYEDLWKDSDPNVDVEGHLGELRC